MRARLFVFFDDDWDSLWPSVTGDGGGDAVVSDYIVRARRIGRR